MDNVLTTILSVLVGGGLLGFIQFLINRRDEKKGKNNQLILMIDGIKKELDQLRDTLAEDRATNARIRILTFSDEILHNVRHSEESFNQVNLDIDTYRRYCRKHPYYQNNRAVMAISNIENVYKKCLESGDFLGAKE